MFAAGRIWSSEAERASLLIGTAAAWAASSISVAWLLWARGRSMKIFLRAFGGGIVLRAVVLLVLTYWTYGNAGLSYEVVLIAYVFALLALLLTLEMRHLKIK